MSRRVLLIDRDQIRRAGWSRVLEAKGFNVIGFDSGKPALNHLLFNSVDALLLEYGSSYEPSNPLSGGKQIVKELSEVEPLLPLVIVCDRSESLDAHASAAADIVLRHPLSSGQLLDAFHTAFSETLRERVQRKSGYIYAFR